jgi:hypothetical protein
MSFVCSLSLENVRAGNRYENRAVSTEGASQ